MKNEKPSIVFFGSGPVASQSLQLLSKDFNIEAVVTKPTTESEMSAIVDKTIVHTVSDKISLDELFTTANFKSSVAVLIDFGIIVSQKIIDYFENGIVNSHFSLLPELRGADPISFAILQGEDKTGVSLMLLVEAMDEGPILAVDELELNGSETGPTLTDSLVNLSDTLIKNTLPSYIKNEVSPYTNTVPTPRSQRIVCKIMGKDFNPTYTRKFSKKDGLIDWHKPATQIDREVRAFLDWPKSKTVLGRTDVIITKAQPVNSNFGEIGDIKIIDKKTLGVQTGDGYLSIENLKPAGKKEMDVQAFLAGYRNKLILS